MAIDHARETRRTSEQIKILSSSTAYASTASGLRHLSDLITFNIGTTRRSEIIGKIGDTGQTYQKILNDYLDTL